MTPYLQDPDVTLYHGDVLDVLRELPAESVDCCVTSPPYLDARSDYASITPAALEDVLRELGRVVAGPILLNLGRVWRDGIELRWHDDVLTRAEYAGWSLLDTLVWIKPNANPIQGRFFANSHEYVYVLGDATTELETDAVRTPYAASSVARLARGWTNHIGVKNVQSDRQRSTAELHPNGARPRSFVVVPIGRDKGNTHPAPMAEELAAHLVKLGCPVGGMVLDPFVGSGTTCHVARKLGRRSVGIDLSAEYLALAARRLQQQSLFALDNGAERSPSAERTQARPEVDYSTWGAKGKGWR